ncbi:hypothetical protein Acr_18g0010500 [Actinidia rufa]|uniref:Uncharacterized protein n=1 Tax=Actinidia rufa TaxID=165716 RepID=A0A7J0G7W0_9ERIC|nr:hypothetical protein Acr_18g0010500 [Actinidia rufa]
MAKEESKKSEALSLAPAEPQPPPPAASLPAKINTTDNVVQEISMFPHPPPPEEGMAPTLLSLSLSAITNLVVFEF